ncbi:Ribosome-binding factor A [Aestuariimicrobium sp. T2.26MG-19.2B]|uniref:30S ribosome-binding factor RbfA n=1 Tax=Aestuariimicrobium sp. T2.26MG-19.2B TaxID=3040679 RepID=UPI002477873A|nr:30S ribosome-binding factor RbfA [Aestuariimicrobium sp. T2.26MG-19.2B]CAI9398854.1 Ribosome-binding factor A [Aestuariimicrobium sp. T2.26MG-19.2B]
MPNPRVAKLADQIKVVVAETLERRIKDPRLGFLTVTDVRLTGDSRDASIFYTVYGTDEERVGTAAALESAKGLLRSTVGKRLGLRFAPTLTFHLDATEESARSIEDLLVQAKRRDAELAAQAATAQFAGEADPYRHEDDDDWDEDDQSEAVEDDEPDVAGAEESEAVDDEDENTPR